MLIGEAERCIEMLRGVIFSSRSPSKGTYDEPGSEISAFLKSCRQIFWYLAAFSGLSNLLMLTGSFFMLQVYDRVLPGRSIPTLIALIAHVIRLSHQDNLTVIGLALPAALVIAYVITALPRPISGAAESRLETAPQR